MKKVLSLAAMLVFFIGFTVAQVPVVTKADVKTQAKTVKTDVKKQAKAIKTGAKKVGVDAKAGYTQSVAAHKQQVKKNTVSADSSKKATKAKISTKIKKIKTAITE